MYYIYILKSLKNSSIYTGFTPDLKRRFKLHNTKKVESTKRFAPWNLIYYEAYKSKDDAIKRERALKLHAKALGQLKRRIKDSLNLKGVGQEPVYKKESAKKTPAEANIFKGERK